jgi:hypothetical protein
MEPLEQITVLMTLMRRLGQVMDHESLVLQSLRLDALPDIQEEKSALAEAYEIELGRLRCSPQVLGALEVDIRDRLHEAMREFQEKVTANLNVLLATQTVVERVLRNIGQSLSRTAAGPSYGTRGEVAATGEARGQVISVAFDRKL